MSVNGLDKITGRILAEANAEAEDILSRAREECAQISADYASRADGIRERLTAKASADAEALIAQTQADAAARERSLLLRQQSELIDGVFAGARSWVLALDTEKYTDLVAGLLAAALDELVQTEERNRALYGDEDPVTAPYEVCLGKKDRARCGEAVVAAVRKKLSGRLPAPVLERLVLAPDALPEEGGAVLRWGEVSCNCTFGLLFAQLRRELEGEVSRALFEERGMKR